MTAIGLMDERVKLHHRSDPTTDASGEPVYAETTEEVSARLAFVNTTAQVETEAGSVVAATLRAFFPPTVDLSTVDYIEARGSNWEVTSVPWTVINPRTGKTSHVAAVLGRAG